MARDLPCSACGKMMYRSATSHPEGLATCLPCRRQRRQPQPREAELRFCDICQEPFESKTPNQKYCSADCRNSRRGFTTDKAATATERGYGAAHRKARREWKAIVDAQGGIECCLCGHWVEASERWHLDHTPERDGYRGVAHALCNVRDGASRGATRTNLQRSYDKACPTCGGAFTTPYPKQAYCSRECRPRREAKPRKIPTPKSCIDCAAPIKQGQRCAHCRREIGRANARNRYRVRVGIPLDTPKYDRSWRAA